ncbi:MAG: outer membrane protein assembly factor BamB family protein, partial [Candidatus Hodarchaeales archaeon]
VTGADRDGDGREDVYIASEDRSVYALRGITGNLLWISNEYLLGKPTSLTTADLDLDGVPDAITGTNRGVYAFSGVNGTLMWYDESGLTVTDLFTYPLLSDGTHGIIYSTLEGYILGINGSSGDALWNTSVSAEAIWDIDYGQNEYRGPVQLFAGSEDGNLYVLSLHSGEVLWSFNPQHGAIIGVGEIEMKVEYYNWYTMNNNASLVASRDGSVTCIYQNRWGQLIEAGINEWSDQFQASNNIERIQAAYLDGDDVKDYYLFLQDSSLVALSGTNGERLWETSLPKRPMTTIAADEDIIIAGSQGGGVYSIVAGSKEKRAILFLQGTGIATAAIHDIDQKDGQEILVGADNGLVALLNTSSGTDSWNTTVSGPVAVLGAIRGGGNALFDVIVGSRDGTLTLLDGETGNIEWVASDPEKDVVSLAIDDFDGDGNDEIAVGSDDSNLYCYDSEGHLLWVNSDLTNSINRLTTGDFDKDGINDLAAGSYYNVSGVKGTTGELLWRNAEPPGYVRAISHGDLNQDQVLDVIVGTYESAYAIDGFTGETIWAQKAEQDVISMDSNDINRDGIPDLIVGTSSGDILLLDGISGRVVQKLDAYHSVEAMIIREGNDDGAELIFTDGSGIRSYSVARIFPEESNTTTTLSDLSVESSLRSNSEPPLISDSSSSFGWTVGIAMISFMILIRARARSRNRGE